MNDYLSIGDRICLFCEDTSGFIVSSSSSASFNELRICTDQDKFSPENVADMQAFVFEVIIQNRYKLHKKYQRNYKNFDENSQDIELKLHAEQARSTVFSEENDNALEQRRNLGKTVHYGDVIQLRHVYTKKYIHVNESKTGGTDKNSMILNLQSHNSKSAQYKIIPRYKVKYEGEPVQYMDLVTFESLKVPLHFFHASKLYQIDNLFYGAEMNLGSEQSGFTLMKSLSYHSAEENENTLKGGDYIQIIHKEIDAYIESDGKLDLESKPDIYLRLRKLESSASMNSHYSSSSTTFWQVEHEKVKLSSEVGEWNNHFRFRHAINRMYLCVKKNSSVALSKSSSNPNTVFRLHPQSNVGEHIMYNSYFRIEHVLTGTWLHGNKDEVFIKSNNLKDELIMEKSLSNLQWKNDNLRKLSCFHQRLYDDAYVIYQVPPETILSFNRFSGYIPLVRNLIEERKKKVQFSASQSYKYTVALEEIRDDLITNGQPNSMNQRHLRNLQIVDLLVELVLLPFHSKADEAFSKKIYRASYEILHNYMKGFSLKNSLYFAKYISLFKNKMLENTELGHKITEMITELLRNNEKVLECIRFEELFPFIDNLRTTQNWRFLEYLETFCVCNGEPLTQNQNEIAKKWLTENQRGVFMTDRGQNMELETNVIYVRTEFDSPWIKMHEFLDETNPLFNRNNKDYFLKQIDLMLGLCFGRNAYCKDLIINKLNYISWEECYAAIKSPLIPNYMKTKYFEIIQTMFIDIGTNYAVIENPKYNFVYSQIQGDSPVAVECMFPSPREKITSKIFSDLSEWIFDFIESTSCMYASSIDLNYLIRIVFIVTNKLVQYGYYDNVSLKRISKSLLKLLNGKLDLPFEYDSKKESSKIRKKLVSSYKQSLRYENSLNTQSIISAKLAGLDIVESIFIYENASVVSQLISRFKKCEQPDVKIQKRRLFGHTHLMPCLNNNFDFNKQYQTSKRATKKMTLEIENLFVSAKYIDPDQWTGILLDLAFYQDDLMNQRSLLILNKLYCIKESSLHYTYGTFISKTQPSQDLQEKLTEYIPMLRLMSKATIGSHEIELMSSMLKEIINVCKIPGSVDCFNPISQRIIVSFGILDIAFKLISQIYRSFEKTNLRYAGTGSLSLVTELLRSLTVSNPSFQEAIFNQLDSLLDLYVHSHPIELAFLLRDGIFLNNRIYCGRLKPYQINKLVLLVAENARLRPKLGSAFVQLLESLTTVDNGEVPLKRNQLLVMKFLMKHFSQVVYVIDSKSMTRNILLTSNSNSEDAIYFVRIIDLFVSCCQGENQYVQSLCQTIIPLEEIMELLVNKEINIVFKRGLLRYISKVYLSKTSIVNQEGIVKNFLTSNYCEELLDCIQQALEMTKSILEKTEHYNLLPILKRPFVVKPPDEFQVTENIQSYLHYAIYGASVFMSSLCSVWSMIDLIPSTDIMSKMKLVNRDVIDIFSQLWKFQLHPSLFLAMTESILQIISYSNLTEIEAKTIALLHCKPQILDQDPRKDIDSLYSDEIDLNLKLQTFLFNCNQLICGQNTVKAQLKVNIKKAYINLHDQNSLPLSVEFQNHIRCFINTNYPKGDMKRYKKIDILIKQLEISGLLRKRNKKNTKHNPHEQHHSINMLDQEALDLRSLQILRGLIYNEECLLPENWETNILDSTVQDGLKTIKHVQNCLNKLNLNSRTQLHMINPCDSVRRESLILQSAMLMNANVKVQESLLKYFNTSQDEVFFSAIRHQLQDAFDDLKDQKLLATQKRTKITREKYNGNGSELEVDSLAQILYHQIVEYEARYEDQYKFLAINESLTTRKVRREIYCKVEKISFESNNKCCIPRKKNITSQMPGYDKMDYHFENLASDEYELKNIVIKDNIHLPLRNTEDNCSLPSDTYEGRVTHADPHQHVKLVLELLSRMCVGQFVGLQNYLRDQPDNRLSVDVVSLVVHFLGNIYASVRPETIVLNILAFETIKEAIMGNQENRSVVYRAKVVDYANFILRNEEINETCDTLKILELLSVIGRVIMALIEENGPQETPLAKEVKITLDIKVIFQTMNKCYEMLEDPRNKDSRNMIYDVGFNYFLILARLEDLNRGQLLKDVQPIEKRLKAFRFFKKGSASIEILKGDQLQRIHFRMKHKEVLRESVKEKVKWEVDRTTPSNKIRSFISWSKLILPDMGFQRKIIMNPLLMFLTKQWNTMNYLLTFLSFLINLLLIIGIRAPDNGFIGLEDPPLIRNPQFDNHSLIWKPEYQILDQVTNGLGVSHSIIALFILVTYLITDRPTPQTFLGYFRTLKIKIWRFLKQEDESEDTDKISTKDTTNVSLFSLLKFFYLVISLGLSIYGYWIPYLYAFHLFNIIQNNQLLKGVIASVTKNGRVLIWVMILMIIVMFIFSIFAFCFFRSTFEPGNYMFSATLTQTFVSIVRFGIVEDLFQYTVPNEAEKDTISHAFSRFGVILIFQLLFFIFITITGMNIIFGIIVDTFSELRDLKFKAEKDMKDMCFICSRAGHDFDQSGSSFGYHVTNEHNMWAYLFYFLHLKEIKINDYFHLDLYVTNMLKSDNYDFFPINRALSLTMEEEEHSRIDEICSNVRLIAEHRKREEQEKTKKKDIFKQSQWQKKYQQSEDKFGSNTDISHQDFEKEDGRNSTLQDQTFDSRPMSQTRFRAPFSSET